MKFLLPVILSALTLSPTLSAEQEVSVAYSYDLSANGNTIQRIILTIDSIIETTFGVFILNDDGYAGAVNTESGSVSEYSYSIGVQVGDLSISGDNAISFKLTRSIDELAAFFLADLSPFESNYQGFVVYEFTYGNTFATQTYPNLGTHPNYINVVGSDYIWDKDESVTIRPKSQYLAYIGEEYAVWFKLNWIIQTDGLLMVLVEDHEIVAAENKDSIRLPTVTQNVNLNAIDPIDIIINNNNFYTVSGSASTVGTFIIQQSVDLENWDNVSSYSLNYPGKISFSTSLPKVSTYEVWEIPADDTTHPNYIEGENYIMLDEPLLQSQPIPKAFFRVIHQTL